MAVSCLTLVTDVIHTGNESFQLLCGILLQTRFDGGGVATFGLLHGRLESGWKVVALPAVVLWMRNEPDISNFTNGNLFDCLTVRFFVIPVQFRQIVIFISIDI